MNAILLCAGFATRMHPLTKELPKALLDIAGEPVIDHLIGQILGFRGLDSITVVTNDRFFGRFLAWGEEKNGEITERGISLYILNDGIRRAEDRLGAAGDLGYAVRHITWSKGTVVAAGDNIFRFPLEPFWEKFLSGDRSYVLALPTEERQRLRKTGVLEIDEDGRVLAFHEKPEDPPSDLACPALYFLKPEALDLIHAYLSSEGAKDEIGYFISYLALHDKVYAIRTEGEAIDIGTIESYERAKRILSEVRVIL
ncbi:MAG: nucleotidyltransferase family protein [Thermodesulfobacteriota bacterium]